MSTKETLLDMVQNILQEIDGDSVNSISDTEESEAVAYHIQAAYRFIISKTSWAHTRRALQLTPRSDSGFPTHMTVPENLKSLLSVRYNSAAAGEARRVYSEVKFCDPDEFLLRINRRDNTSESVDVVLDDSGIELLIINNAPPRFYTSFDDVNIVFDSYDLGTDSTVQASKVQAIGHIIPEFLIEDNFVPDLPSEAFPYLTEEALSRCQIRLRQVSDSKAEGSARQHSRTLSRNQWTAGGGTKYPNYGRK